MQYSRLEKGPNCWAGNMTGPGEKPMCPNSFRPVLFFTPAVWSTIFCHACIFHRLLWPLFKKTSSVRGQPRYQLETVAMAEFGGGKPNQRQSVRGDSGIVMQSAAAQLDSRTQRGPLTHPT